MASNAFLLSRVLLRFDDPSSKLLSNISAGVLSPDGSLWLGSDELNTIERLSLVEPYIFGNHEAIAIANFINLADPECEVDIEGIDYSNHYLWFTGSHSTKRKRTKGKKLEKDIQRLAEVETELNRYLIGRIPLVNGTLTKSCAHPRKPEKELTAASLQTTEQGNVLTDALKDDIHLAEFMSISLPSKENGFDIEGLAVHKNRIFLGLRGPVLRGWAIVLELEVESSTPDVLTLKHFPETGRPYKKHFLDLDGLGVRELCWHGDDLLILAGPTMDLAGATRLFRMKNALSYVGDTLFSQESGELEVVFDLPFHPDGDKAEGLMLFSCFGKTDGLLMLYDAPDKARLIGNDAFLADVFRLE